MGYMRRKVYDETHREKSGLWDTWREEGGYVMFKFAVRSFELNKKQNLLNLRRKHIFLPRL